MLRPFDTTTASGITRRGKRGTFPGRLITIGAPNHCGGADNTKNVTSTFFNTVNLFAKELKFEHGDAKFASCPGREFPKSRQAQSYLCFTRSDWSSVT